MLITDKKAFTMIELIFVIVIIGILAAVAIPKLTATRDDAKIANIISNAKISLGDFQKYYTSQGAIVWSDVNLSVGTVTDVPLRVTNCAGDPDPTQAPVSSSTLALCDEGGGVACVTMAVTTTGVTMTAVDGSTICAGVLSDPAIVGMIGGTDSGTSKLHILGGFRIDR